MPKHDFKIMPYSKDLTYEDVELTEVVSINDNLIIYIMDSLKWVNSYWNNLQKKESGLNYYGVTFINEKEEVQLFKSILVSWVSLFQNAPEQFNLTTATYPDEVYTKHDILKELGEVITLCDAALHEKYVLVHYGI